MNIILTRADHWCILRVYTVMNTPWTVPTNRNGTFISLTLNIVQPNLSTSLTEPGAVWSTESRRIPKLTADNSRIIYIPAIVTNSSPDTSVIDLHSALSRPPSSNQSQSWRIKELHFIYITEFREVNWHPLRYSIHKKSKREEGIMGRWPGYLNFTQVIFRGNCNQTEV